MSEHWMEIAGALLAVIAHLSVFNYVDGKLASGPLTFSQRYLAVISHMITSTFRASLTASVLAVFTQHLWSVMRTEFIATSTFESLHQIRQDFTHLGKAKTLMASPILYGLAVVLWLIPFATLYPGGSLTVITIPHQENITISMPTSVPEAREPLSWDSVEKFTAAVMFNVFYPLENKYLWEYEYGPMFSCKEEAVNKTFGIKSEFEHFKLELGTVERLRVHVLPDDLLPDAAFPLGHMRRLKPHGPINLTSAMLQNYEAINLLAQVEALILALKVNETYVTYDFVPTNRTITLPDGATKDVVQSIFSHIISCPGSPILGSAADIHYPIQRRL
ncbi:hypothetical protein B0J14DRAFT_642237 [Halenospora varia]|nr:hypothetical protein B0J14DRAFT_642237 [Halenospora varia]